MAPSVRATRADHNSAVNIKQLFQSCADCIEACRTPSAHNVGLLFDVSLSSASPSTQS